ncbi:MAG: clostripain-related cysteine peptidase [Clostridia bacterium]
MLTVLMYVVGSDLESESGHFTRNLRQMLSVQKPDTVNLVLQTGGTRVWQNDCMQDGQTQRFERTADGLRCLETMEAQNTGDAQTLRDFLVWGVTTYPAERYLLLFWNHGGGAIAGFGADEQFGQDALDLAELQSAMQYAQAQTHRTFEWVGFDACLMASIETAQAVKGTAHYLIASQALEAADGWDYEALLHKLYAEPSQEAAAMGRMIADTYAAAGDAQRTLSVIDLEKIDAVADALDALSSVLSEYLAEDPATRIYTLCGAAGKAMFYGGGTEEEGFSDMMDLGDLTRRWQACVPTHVSALCDALDTAVTYQATGSAHVQASGMSVYFPLRDQAKLAQARAFYERGPTPEAYRRLVLQSIDAIEAAQSAPRTPRFTEPIWLDEAGWCRTRLDPTRLSQMHHVFFTLAAPYQEQTMLLLGEDQNLQVDPTTGEVREGFDCKWPAIDGHFVAPRLLTQTPQAVTYAIPALLDGQQVSIRAAFVWDDDMSGHYELQGAWPGIDANTHMPARDCVPLTPGSVLTPIYPLLNVQTGEKRWTAGVSFALTEAVMAEKELISGTYALRFGVCDALFQYEYTDFLTWNFAE